MSDPPLKKQPGRPFTKGVSGNLAGRPPGTRNRVLLALDKIGGEAAQGVLQAAVAAALEGDVSAQNLILSRAWPARRGRPITLDLPRLETAADLVPALGAVAAAVGDGELSPEEGQAVAAVLEIQRKAIETSDLERRIAAIEMRKA